MVDFDTHFTIHAIKYVGRINVNKILHDNPTKRVAYCRHFYLTMTYFTP